MQKRLPSASDPFSRSPAGCTLTAGSNGTWSTKRSAGISTRSKPDRDRGVDRDQPLSLAMPQR
jgi:hypothetical protein